MDRHAQSRKSLHSPTLPVLSLILHLRPQVDAAIKADDNLEHLHGPGRVRMFTGQESMRQRNDILSDINNPRSNVRVLLCSIRTGAVGINMVSTALPFS